MNKNKYKITLISCYIAYTVQAIITTFVPLLFVSFNKNYGIPFSKITIIITLTFLLQLLIDFLSVYFVDKIGYKFSAILGDIFALSGIFLMSVLPDLFIDPFIGLIISVILYATGAGLLEVVISPMAESCVDINDTGSMSMLHAFYCWGCVIVVLVSSLFFFFFKAENYKFLIYLWCLVPLINIFLFIKSPVRKLVKDERGSLSIKELFKTKFFWVTLILIFSSGASEQAVAQWASVYIENGLNISKEYSDLLGPLIFSVNMGISRTLYSKLSKKISLNKFMISSAIVCAISYLLLTIINVPIINIIGFALVGFSVGIFWPGTLTVAERKIERGGTALFAYAALMGDLGCSMGPTITGFVSTSLNDNIHLGLLPGIIFPIIILVILLSIKNDKNNRVAL